MITKTLLTLLFITVYIHCAAPSAGVHGLDLSSWQGNVTQQAFNCLRQSTFKDFAIFQAWRSSGTPNPYVNDDIKKARAAGYKHIDSMIAVFLFIL